MCSALQLREIQGNSLVPLARRWDNQRLGCGWLFATWSNGWWFYQRKQDSMENCMPHHPAKLHEDIRTWAREMRGRMTDAEALLWMLLRNRRIAGAKFRRQHPVERYILDFYCVEKQLGIELDGGQHGDAVEYDQRRDSWLQKQGIRTLRFWNNQVLMETEAVMEVIYQAVIEINSDTQVPLPQAGEGLG